MEKLSEILQQLHDCGDVGDCVEGLAEMANELELCIDDMTCAINRMISSNKYKDGGQFASYWETKLSEIINNHKQG